MAHQSDRPIAIIDNALVQPLSSNLSDISLGSMQNSRPFGDQRFRRQGCMSRPLHTNELGDVFEVLTEDVLTAFFKHRHGANAEGQQLRLSARVVDDVNGDEVNALLRKKLFRSQATASTGLCEQDKFISDTFHGRDH
jgi:hypothetical protein